MSNELAPILFFLGTMFFIAGLIYLIVLRRQRTKYKIETLATISSCREYTQTKDNDRYIYQALILDFVADNKTYKVRRDIGKKRNTSRKNKHYSMGENVKLYYNPKNPEEIDLDINNFRKWLKIFSFTFTSIGFIFLLAGVCLTLYRN